ncbi:hypothetical protein [Lebetimonas sp. JH369]|uniref:hypothetical protein n=1 Tax=Lebetimonas sp. JH369 TaxID=990069 RepID=UPI0004642C57|nr:hypothetical protein [Lebetimonas sp. JH369]
MNKITVLISSHSKAFDLWAITDYFLSKYWNDIKIYLGANGEDMQWNYINDGKDISFSKSLLSYLESIDDEYFILMLDDFIILKEVDNSKIEKAFEFIKSKNGVYLRLIPNPKGDIKIDENYSKFDVKKGVPYITSLQMAIWKKEFLIQLLKYDFNPWEFEIKAGKTKKALQNYDKFFVTNCEFINYTHFVEKGKFYPFIKDLQNEKGLNIEINRNFIDMQKIKENKLKVILRNLVPNKYQNKLRKILGKKEL